MDAVYLLWHVHTQQDREDDEKLIGVYRTESDARGAIERVRDQPGFRHFPEGFMFEKYELNKDHWTEGFVVVVRDADGTQTIKYD